MTESREPDDREKLVARRDAMLAECRRLEGVVSGIDRAIEIVTTATDCPNCAGFGLVRNAENQVYDCPRCGGWGWVTCGEQAPKEEGK